MKLQHIRQSLDDIKTGDLMILEELKDRIADLEHSLNEKYIELDRIKERKKIINNILNIKDDKRLLFRFFRPILDFLLMAIGAILVFISTETISILLLIFISIILGLSVDAFNIIRKDYSKVTEKDDFIGKKIINAYLNIIRSREHYITDMSKCLTIEETINKQIKQMEQEIFSKRNERNILNDEISFIEGNMYAVNCLINKYKFEEINNETSLAQFIQCKKELRKAMAPNSY